MSLTLDHIRRLAASHSLFETNDLAEAITRMGYVQADPIRAPARAQDLILRQRVPAYRADELENRYPELPVFEDMFHNYGFFPIGHRALIYPRVLSRHWIEFLESHDGLRRKALRHLRDNAEVHPRELEEAVGDGARVNGWGGSSSATTLMLEALHRQGKARVVRRAAGIRVYAAVNERHATLSPARRAEERIRLLVNLYAPLPQATLRSLINVIGRGGSSPNLLRGHAQPKVVDHWQRLEKMIAGGEFVREKAEGETWVLPEALLATEPVIEDRVRLLAPFDPVVWDRRRFEHLWDWAYRFEAYTPLAKRKLGYYALPMLWRDQVIGWANARVEAGRKPQLKVEFGYATKKPREAAFRLAQEAEVETFRRFLVSA